MKKTIAALLAFLGIHKHLNAQQKQDLSSAALQVTPGGAASLVAKADGIQLADVLTFVTIAFVVLQAAYLVWKWRRDYLRSRSVRAIPSTDWGEP